jgi:hypothetical protein
MSGQRRPSVATRDLFLCQAVAIIAFLVAQRIGFYSNWLLGLAVVLILPIICGLIGAKMRGRAIGALNAYSFATMIGALLFLLKWWTEIATRSA